MSIPASPARLIANRQNATHSTGPKTDAGKAKASLNAVTTGLTGRTVLLATDDVAHYERHLAAYARKWNPQTEDEKVLVQSLADTDWRLTRIPGLILALEAKAREEMENECEHLNGPARSLRIDLEGFLKYEKQLRSLQLQENRLHRRREKDSAELRAVIAEREARQAQEMSLASAMYLAAQRDGQTFDPSAHGFELSIEEIDAFLSTVRRSEELKTYILGPQNSPAAA